MGGKLLSLLVLALAVVLVSAQESDVLTLTSENFQSTLDANPMIAIEFYAPWCGHCKSLAPEWESAATSLKGKVALAKVDCTVEEKLCGTYQISGFPTLKLFRDGKAEELQVGRKADVIVAYLNAELLPALTILKSQAEVDSFLETHKLAVVGYLESEQGEQFTTFDKLASKLRRSFTFGAVHDAQVAADKTRPTIVLHRNFDEPIVVYSGEHDLLALEKWASLEKLPLLGEISGDTYASYMATEMPVGYLFVDPANDNTATFNIVKEIAKKLKQSTLFTWVDNTKYAQFGTRMGLSGKVVPSLVIDDAKKGARYLFAEETPMTELAKWVESYVKGELTPFVKSEEIPAQNDGPVKVMVAHTFESIAMDPSKDVFVEFYAPWCGHCQKLAPVWEELGQAYKDSSKVVIAKIDANANDVPPALNIRGFPTIYLFLAEDKKNPVLYEGARELNDFKQFLLQHTKEAAADVEVEEEEKAHDDTEL